MPYPQVREALTVLAASLAERPELEGALLGRLRRAGRLGAIQHVEEKLPDDVLAIVDRVGAELPPLTLVESESALLARLFSEPSGHVLFVWCAASTWRRDAKLAELLAAAAA